MIFRKLLVLCLLVALPVLAAQDARKAGQNPKAVLPSLRRAEAIKTADELLAKRPAEIEALIDELPDPFYPALKRSRKPGVKEAAPVVEDSVLLARAAESIRPQGTMLIGSEPYLLLDGKRYKSGDFIPVTIDGAGVQISVTSIQRNSYTLRLRDQELRREFK